MTRRPALHALLSLLALAVAGCATVGGPRVITFSEADLARMLEQHGPFKRTLLGLIDVDVHKPSVRVVSSSSRLASSLDVVATERVSRQTLKGRIAIQYGVRYDAQEKAIRMTDVRVDTLDMGDVPAEKRKGVQNLGALIAEHMLDDAVLYRFRPADLQSAEGRGLRPESVAVTSRGVEVRLAPLAP